MFLRLFRTSSDNLSTTTILYCTRTRYDIWETILAVYAILCHGELCTQVKVHHSRLSLVIDLSVSPSESLSSLGTLVSFPAWPLLTALIGLEAPNI